MRTQDAGRAGENFAVQYLQENGYEILERNWRTGHSEIDIIAHKGDIIAFIEVKLRNAESFSTPAQSIRPAQRKRIVLAAVVYLQEKSLYGTQTVQPRFDVFEIVTKSKSELCVLSFNYIEHAYDLEGLGVFL